MATFKPNTNIFYPLLKAEAVYAELIQNGYTPEEILTTHLGTFKKRFSSDIEKLSIEDEEVRREVQIEINRDSIYDLLPEGLFHQSRGASALKNVDDAVLEHKRFKAEEKDARKVFAPFEQTIFQFVALAELEDRRLRYNMHHGKFNETFSEFWNLDKQIPDKYRNKILGLIPYLSVIKCDKHATALSLEYVLDLKITIDAVFEKVGSNQLQNGSESEMILGLNTQLGETSVEEYPCWRINIEDISSQEIVKFLPQNPLGKTISRFMDIFVPYYVDVVIDYIISKKEPENKEYVLGYGAIL